MNTLNLSIRSLTFILSMERVRGSSLKCGKCEVGWTYLNRISFDHQFAIQRLTSKSVKRDGHARTYVVVRMRGVRIEDFVHSVCVAEFDST